MIKRIADHLVIHLNFLEEELAIIELTGTQAQLRSRQPFESEPHDRVYFELMIDGHGNFTSTLPEVARSAERVGPHSDHQKAPGLVWDMNCCVSVPR